MFYTTLFFFFKQKTAYEMRISDWSSDVCASDLRAMAPAGAAHRDGQVALAFALIARQQVFQHAGELVEEGAEAGVLRHVIGHRGILSAEQIGRASCRERVCQYV